MKLFRRRRTVGQYIAIFGKSSQVEDQNLSQNRRGIEWINNKLLELPKSARQMTL